MRGLCCLLINCSDSIYSVCSPWHVPGTEPCRGLRWSVWSSRWDFYGLPPSTRTSVGLRRAAPWRWRRLHNTGFSVTAVNVKQALSSRWVTSESAFVPHVRCRGSSARPPTEGLRIQDQTKTCKAWVHFFFFVTLFAEFFWSLKLTCDVMVVCFIRNLHAPISYMREGGSKIWRFTLPFLESATVASSCLLSTACERRERCWPVPRRAPHTRCGLVWTTVWLLFCSGGG